MKKQNCIKLFRFSGITVYLHLSWIVVAIFEIQNRRGDYSSLTYNIAEYLALFITVLLHEFGHSLACKQVGGSADTIMLWPLGGIAYVSPPQRPGAVLWSIAAGPLVNVVLGVLSFAVLFWMSVTGLQQSAPDIFNLFNSIVWINVGLFAFNILPIYPLDGGQLLRAMLWFIIGPISSLKISSIIGIVGSLSAAIYSLYRGNTWLVIMSVFLVMHAWRAYKTARIMQPE